jgi:fumarylpyruvate hydrolase
MSTADTERFAFPPAPQPYVEILTSAQVYPVTRIFCVGRNYAEHAKEMGVDVDRGTPFYFMKPANALVASGATVPYPPGTSNYHYEMELVVAMGTPVRNIDVARAQTSVFGYACGLDMTRRDLQLAARAKGRPWDLGKGFEHSAVVAPLTITELTGELGQRRIALSVNGVTRQDARLSDLLWSVPEIIAHLSHYITLVPGDLIFTGTPAGVGPVVVGDRLEGTIEGLEPVVMTVGPPVGGEHA